MQRPAMAVAAVGGVACAIGWVIDPRRAAAAYLVAYVVFLGVALGALAMIMIARMSAATWFIACRRDAEHVTAVLPALAILFLPVILSARLLYPWVDAASSHSSTLARAVAAKQAYLNFPWFVARAVIYWVVWISLAELLRRVSIANERRASALSRRRMNVISAVGLPLYAFTVSFASFDWMMSLSPAWYSTIYGVYYFSGCMVGALALLTVIVARRVSSERKPGSADEACMQALAKLLLTFVLFWAYIGFSQLIVIWSADLPAENSWYLIRLAGGWKILAAVLVAGHLLVPFLVLLVRAVRKSSKAMAAVGVLLLVMHYLDGYWMVMPDAAPARGGPHWLDAGAVLLIGGVCALMWRRRRAAFEIIVGTGHAFR